MHYDLNSCQICSESDPAHFDNDAYLRPTSIIYWNSLALSAQYEDPLSIFLYALKAPETKRQYPRRLKVFLDFLKLDGTLEQQSKEFLEKAKQNPQWAQNSLMQFIALQKERARKGEISYSTIANYYKATKLFVEMNSDTPIINWKRIICECIMIKHKHCIL